MLFQVIKIKSYRLQLSFGMKKIGMYIIILK